MPLLNLAVLLSALLAIGAHYRGTRSVEYLAKPLTTLLILGVAAATAPAGSIRYAGPIVTGLLFATAGDWFLLGPGDRFRSGLGCFLVTHLCYLIAFTSGAPARFAAFPFFLPFGIFGGTLLTVLWPVLGPPLRLPVTAYVAVLVAMAGQALARQNVVHSASGLAAAVGASLFVASDTLLALDRFRRPFRSARAMVRGTYYLSQWLIAVSVRGG